MKIFTDRLIDDILFNYDKEELYKLKLIVPSKRAKWQISKTLTIRLRPPFILPQIETIHEYIISLSELNLIDNHEARIILCKELILLDNSISVEAFYNESASILKEYNNIESYMIDHKNLFYELSNIKEIENWSLREENLSNNQQELIKEFKKLGDLFTKFKTKLLKEKKGISGMIFRNVAENLNQYFQNENDIYFIGLNALSTSEEKIINHLTKQNKAKSFIDVDKFYADNKEHEAGHFYRKHKSLKYNDTVNYLEKSSKEITIHESNTTSQQIEIINQIIFNKKPNQEFTIVTMDESLGPIIFDTLIKFHKNVNFSSGISFNHFESIKLLKFLHKSLIDGLFNKESLDFNLFSKLLNFNILSQNIKNKEIIENKFDTSNSYKISFSNLKWEKSDFDKLIFETIFLQKCEKESIPNQIRTIIHILKNIFKESKSEANVLNVVLSELNFIEKINNKYNFHLNQDQLMRTLLDRLNNKKVAVKGNKSAKIQILGLLESRILDVDNLIYVSCNEDYLPKKEINNGLLPNDLKKHYGLPSKYEKEALFAYYFYRSLHLPKNIHLIKVKESSVGIESNEGSRYLKQVEIELNKVPKINIHLKSYEPINEKKINHPKSSETVIKGIENWMSNGVSPSSIITFTTCPLEFYYRYILKVKEEKIPDKFLHASEWGTGIHQTLENLYKQYEIINIDSVKKMNSDLDKFMDHEFDLIFKDKRHLKGKNAIIYYHFKKCLDHYFIKEIDKIKKSGSFKIIGLEKDIIIEDEIEIDNSLKKIKFKGIIDRIDSTSEGLRLIDYKSGLVQPKDLILNNFDQLQERSKALQLLFYAMLYTKHNDFSEPIKCQIISIKNSYQPTIQLKINKEENISSENIMFFKQWLKEFLLNINDKSLVFKHNTESKFCNWC